MLWILDCPNENSKIASRFSQAFVFLLNLKSKMSSYDSIRPRQQIWRYRQTDLLRCFEVDHKLKLHWLLHWQIGGFSAFQDFVDIGSGAAVQISIVWSVAHEAAIFDKFTRIVYRRESALSCKVRNPYALSKEN